jgi:mannose/fructose/N-acetylgalactosamine-specific phosphotransferase system component IIB
MPLDLVRIDDRLIHGQVVVGWGSFLKTTKIILCNDAIAASKIDSDLCKSAAEIAMFPLTIAVLTQPETMLELKKISDEDRIILLIESPQEAFQLLKAGLVVKLINVGGMHFKEGKHQIAPYIYVDEDDIATFKRIAAMGVKLEGKDVPTAKAIDIARKI